MVNGIEHCNPFEGDVNYACCASSSLGLHVEMVNDRHYTLVYDNATDHKGQAVKPRVRIEDAVENSYSPKGENYEQRKGRDYLHRPAFPHQFIPSPLDDSTPKQMTCEDCYKSQTVAECS